MSVGQLAAGELDLVIRVPPAEGPGLANTPGLKQLNVPGVGIFNINFHNTNTDKQLRQAIAYAINRPEAIEQVLGGLATINYTIPPGFTVYPDINKYEFDLAKGKELLAQSSWDINKTFRLALSGRGSELHRHRPGTAAVHRGPRAEGRADRPADGAVHRPDPEER